MIYEQALLKALETSKGKAIQRSCTKKRKYWRKLIKIELKRIRAGHMTDPWINAAMRYWMSVDKWGYKMCKDEIKKKLNELKGKERL